ncbi:hypothetical protein VB773_06270 [Haloarculaceae archaeon H-GB2-1]|nr:hypothetical protein [Haloarculaceae archaeon H-GB11]MEA5407215.1 hypothetical protein [Haloarculaceae archaeon H-GB2-1]
MGTFTEELPDDLRHREAFERADDLMQQQRLTEGDFAKAREALEPVAADVDRLTERERAAEAYEQARYEVDKRRSTVEEEIASRERLVELGEADLDAPTDELRDPIESYDEAVAEAFRAFKADRSAREVLAFVATAAEYPLVPFRDPPTDLREYVESHEAGTEPIPQLLTYAEYSHSKLDHYVEDPAALRQQVATRQTYLRRVNAEPLTVGWPPPQAEVLRYRCGELLSVVEKFADESVSERLRAVRAETRDQDRYERLRNSAVARAELTDEERRRLTDGTIENELSEYRAERERLTEALDDYPSL